MTKQIRNLLMAVGAVLLFVLLSYGFVPDLLSGKVVNQSDISGYQGMAHEMSQYNKANPGDETQWTGSMFSGMPTVTIDSHHKGDFTEWLYKLLLWGKRPASYLFVSLLGAFLMLLALGIHPLIAVGGAIAVTFCSYNPQIIQVGHNTKMQALAFLPWVLAALFFTYRKALESKKWLSGTVLGAALFALALSFQVKANHPQITYYLAIIIVAYAITMVVWVFCSKERRKALAGRFVAASAILLVLGVAGLATNANKLIPTWEYTANSMRGGSEIKTNDTSSKGLDLGYATAWSYGWEELPNMMIPNFNGGSSAGAVNPKKSETVALLKRAGQPNVKEVAKSLPMYWGPQPFTAGPMYMGAITIFLFVLGLCVFKGKEKWWIVASSVVAILLSLGSHFMWFTKLWFDYAPMYNKFRTVSMALVVLQFTLPLLACLTLDRIVKEGLSASAFVKKSWVALALTGGFCLLCILVPSIAGDFSAASDSGQPDILTEAFRADRRMLLVNDALRSMLLITGAWLLLIWGCSVPSSAKETFAGNSAIARGRRATAALLICVLIAADLFTAGKRYLNSDDFVTPKAFRSQFDQRPADKFILEDTDPSYRVVDLSVNIFNDSHPSYWHKNIGGYSPAKLQRYQNLIERYLTKEINSIYSSAKGATTIGEIEERLPELPILSALNCRYIIVDGNAAAATNANAYGNAWFVSSTLKASSPAEELDLIGSTDLRSVAVLAEADDVAFSSEVSESDEISLTGYSPKELRYKYSTGAPRLAVFSEVFYPSGWKAWIADTGEEVSILRADWTLRAALLPEGSHELVMRYEPQSYVTGTRVSMASSILILIAVVLSSAASIVLTLRKKEE